MTRRTVSDATPISTGPAKRVTDPATSLAVVNMSHLARLTRTLAELTTVGGLNPGWATTVSPSPAGLAPSQDVVGGGAADPWGVAKLRSYRAFRGDEDGTPGVGRQPVRHTAKKGGTNGPSAALATNDEASRDAVCDLQDGIGNAFEGFRGHG